jgi:hypothetical protein
MVICKCTPQLENRKEIKMDGSSKIIKNINNLLAKATYKQLRIIYLVAYEFIKKPKTNI